MHMHDNRLVAKFFGRETASTEFQINNLWVVDIVHLCGNFVIKRFG